MNKIEQMIAELCPDGVEFKALGEIGAYSKTRIDATEVNEDNYVGVSKHP